MPDPLTARKDPDRASAKWRTGEILESASNQAGGFWRGTKSLEMNKSGRIEAFTTAGAASAGDG